ncbi:MAG: PD40 domain-containing protein [Sphingobacteriales bacterium]|nr:MAG: PD40 domain-containing protein [Sphingobacteriales bacterium]
MKYLLLPIAVFVCFLSCGKLPVKTQSSDKEYRIAYNIHLPDTSKDDWEIFSMNLDGSDKKNISNHPDVAWTYHAYQNRLFFISDRDTCYRCFFLYEMDAEGKNIKKVSALRLEDSWMSSRNNGQELVVTGRKGNQLRHQLFIVNTLTGKYSQITSDTIARYGDPCFSPDGKQIVYSFKQNKRDKATHEELFLMNADGTNSIQLTHYPENNPSAKEYGYRAGSAKWHPTENFISYVSKQDGRHSIFAITPDGKKQWKLIENELSEGWHDWSPDGKWVVFNSSDNEESQYHITLMNWTTKESKQLTDNKFKSQLSPVFVELK